MAKEKELWNGYKYQTQMNISQILVLSKYVAQKMDLMDSICVLEKNPVQLFFKKKGGRIMEWIEIPNTNEYEPDSCAVQICKTKDGPCGVFVCTGEKFCGIVF